MSMKVYTSIDQHIASQSKETQVLLKQLRATLKKLVPDGVETMSYGIPTIDVNGRHLVHFAGYEHHIGFYPGPVAVAVFKKDMKNYVVAKGSIQFPLDKKLPLGLITKIMKFRLKVERER